MTVVGEAFVQITPQDKQFEAKVKSSAEKAAKQAAAALDDIPVELDVKKLDASVVTAAKRAAKKAADELRDIPGGVDAATFETKVAQAAQRAAAKAQARLDNIPAGVNVAELESRVSTAAAQAAATAASKLDAIPMNVDARGFVTEVDRAMDGAERRVEQGGQKMARQTTSTFSGLSSTITKGLALVGGAQFLRGSIDAFREAEKGQRQTEAAIRSTGGVARVTAKDMDTLTQAVRRKTQVDDDEIRKGANLLLTFTNVRNEVGKGNDVFSQSVGVLTDMAAAMGTDVSSGAIQLGKALNDPVAGITALTRVGVTFTAQQKETIKTLTEAGDRIGAQKIILRELTKEFGGSAAAQADDLDRLGLKYDDFKEKAGGALLRVVGAVADLPGPVQAGGLALAGLALTAVGVAKVADAVGSLAERAKGLSGGNFAGLAGGLARLGGVVGVLALAEQAVGALAGAVDRWQFGPSSDMSQLTNDLVRFGKEMRVQGELARQFGGDLSGLGDKLDLLDKHAHPGLFKRLFDKGVNDPAIKDAQRDIDDLDKALADLVNRGQSAAAADILGQVAKQGGVKIADLKKPLNDYADALAEADTQQRLAADSGAGLASANEDTAGSLDDVATSADDAKKAVDDFRTSLDDALGIQVDAARSAIDYRDAVDALGKSVAENGRTLDLNTDAGRRNQEALLNVIDATRSHVEAMAAEGASAIEVRAAYQQHRDELVRVAGQLGLNSGQVATYVGILDSIPPTVFTDLAVKDDAARAKVASFVKLLNDKLNTEVIVTVTLDPATGTLKRTVGPQFREHGGSVRAGEGYIVGEKRPEWFVPWTNGWVFPEVPHAAAGAIVPPSPNGTLVRVAEAGRPEAVLPLPPTLLTALERLANPQPPSIIAGNLVVQGATANAAYVTGVEVVRQLAAEVFRATGGRIA